MRTEAGRPFPSTIEGREKGRKGEKEERGREEGRKKRYRWDWRQSKQNCEERGKADEGPADVGPIDEGPTDEGPADEDPADKGITEEGPMRPYRGLLHLLAKMLRIDGPTDRRTDGPTDRRTQPLLEMRGRIYRYKKNLRSEFIEEYIV